MEGLAMSLMRWTYCECKLKFCHFELYTQICLNRLWHHCAVCLSLRKCNSAGSSTLTNTVAAISQNNCVDRSHCCFRMVTRYSIFSIVQNIWLRLQTSIGVMYTLSSTFPFYVQVNCNSIVHTSEMSHSQ